MNYPIPWAVSDTFWMESSKFRIIANEGSAPLRPR